MRTRTLLARPLTARALALLAALAIGVSACGLRTDPRPPEDTAPVIPGIVRRTTEGEAVVLRWKRAASSADGMKLEDLAAFVVEKRSGEDQPWQRAATIDVTDQEKFRRRNDYSWREEDAAAAGASYRVFAVCADGQEGPAVAATDQADATADATADAQPDATAEEQPAGQDAAESATEDAPAPGSRNADTPPAP
ncbi:MAG: hypothetical protein ABR538_07650 [Candidatus Binatia bacterium]